MPYLIPSLIVLAASAFALAAFTRSGAADDTSEQVFGDVANLPRGLIRKRPATFIDVTITRLGGEDHRQHIRTGGR